MGAWGVGIFENDTALDWAADLPETAGADFLEQSLATPREEGYLDSDVAVPALAAAEVVAALLRRPSDNLPEDVRHWISSNSSLDVGHLVKKGIATIDDVLGPDSEIRELWEESEEFAAWQSGVADLRARLVLAGKG